MSLLFFSITIFASLVQTMPGMDSELDVDRAINAMHFVSDMEEEGIVLDRDLQSDETSLKCIHDQPANGQPAKVVKCDILGGAQYCAKMVAPWGTAKTCGVGVILDAFKYFGLTSDGCTTNSGYTFCLCSTDECN